MVWRKRRGDITQRCKSVPADLEACYRECRKVARNAASSFPWTFTILPPPKRRAMDALYAFARRTDDLVDGDEPKDVRRERLLRWRSEFERSLRGESSEPLLIAMSDTIHRFQIPDHCLRSLLDGVERDLTHDGFATTADLDAYCYQVASTVGLACVHIWGFIGSADDFYDAAVQCGQAFQFTNILRDLREDAANHRLYVPEEVTSDLHFAREHLLQAKPSDDVARMLSRMFVLTEERYLGGAKLSKHLSPDGRRVFSLMFAVYRELFAALRRREAEILERRVRLGPLDKLSIVTRWLLGTLRTV